MFFIRSAVHNDLEKIKTLLAKTWHATYDDIYGAEKVAQITSSWHSLAALKRNLEAPHSEFLVADDATHLAGMAFARIIQDKKPLIELLQLYVDPQFQRMGIGRDLFAEIETCFPDAELLRLEVEEKNIQAIAFYKAHGFNHVATNKDCAVAGSNIPALIMEKQLISKSF